MTFPMPSNGIKVFYDDLVDFFRQKAVLRGLVEIHRLVSKRIINVLWRHRPFNR